MKSINPATEEIIQEYTKHKPEEVQQIIKNTQADWLLWKEKPIEKRANLLREVAKQLREEKEKLAKIICLEMGKILPEAFAEVEKSATVCEYYANHAKEMLKDEFIESDAFKSMITYEPLGIVLGVMPWNFPFWQVYRFAAPAIMAGNAALLKHSSNVQGCAQWIEYTFTKAGLPKNLFRNLIISSDGVEAVINNKNVKAVSLTGSESAGSAVAAQAGKALKKSVLELGGADPFIVCCDADLKKAADTAIIARMINNGQSCIAAKRFIVLESVHDEFVALIKNRLEKMKIGNPTEEGTDIGPLARKDLRDELHQQVLKSVDAGAKLIFGGTIPERSGYYFMPALLTDVKPGMPVFDEETFGPVMPIIKAKDMDEAIKLANLSEFGLGASIWSNDITKAEKMAGRIESGSVFINGMTKSDPRLPFGGIKKSGFGRELSYLGIREFVNIKTIWIGLVAPCGQGC